MASVLFVERDAVGRTLVSVSTRGGAVDVVVDDGRVSMVPFDVGVKHRSQVGRALLRLGAEKACKDLRLAGRWVDSLG